MVLTAEGFKRKRYDDFIAEMEDQARELWGTDVNLSERGPLGLFIKNIAFARAEENELAEAVYYSGYYFTAEGVNLDYVVANRGMQREAAAKGVGMARFGVDAGITVAAGTIIATKDGIEFVTTDEGQDADGDGIVEVAIEASIAGTSGNVLANTIVEIVTPAVGVNSVTNPLGTLYGREAENDADLRQRFANTFSVGSSTVDGLRTKLLNEVPGVRAALVFENKNDVADEEGRPPHSFEAVVYGGDEAEVVRAIFEGKPGGIRAYGKNEFTIIDESGNEQVIAYSKAVPIPLYVRVTVHRDGQFPAISLGQKMVKSEVIKYIGGLDDDGIDYNGLGMGDKVVVAKMAGNIFYNVPGVKDCIIELSKDGGATWTKENITVGRLEVAATDGEKVVINVV